MPSHPLSQGLLLLILLASLATLAGCGHKGPLWVPDEPDGEVLAPPATEGR